MPEVKINVRSPFLKKYQASNLHRVDLEIFIYSGTKTTDKGTSKYYITKYPVEDNDYVIVDFAEIVRDYITPKSTAPLNSNKDYIKWVQIEERVVQEFVPDCSNFTGFAVAQDGTITAATNTASYDLTAITYVDVDDPGTETTPPSYNANTSGSPITRTVIYKFRIPSGFAESESKQKTCTLTADQPSS